MGLQALCYKVFGMDHKIQDGKQSVPNMLSIKADYLMKNHMEGKNLFLFLSNARDDSKESSFMEMIQHLFGVNVESEMF